MWVHTVRSLRGVVAFLLFFVMPMLLSFVFWTDSDLAAVSPKREVRDASWRHASGGRTDRVRRGPHLKTQKQERTHYTDG